MLGKPSEMASSNHPKVNVEDQRINFVFSPAKDIIEYKDVMMREMARKMEHKDICLKPIQETRLEKEQLKKSEAQLKSKVRDLETEIEELKAENQTLMVKERTYNGELQAACKEAIRELQNMLTHHRASFGIKMMGQVSRMPFEDMCLKTCSNKDWREESAELCSLWEENVRNPHWYHSKRIKLNGSLQEAIDEEDAKLKQLRNEGNEKVYGAVANALLELNEYNPSGGYPILELWNNKEKRKASLKEIIQYIIKQLKITKPKKKTALLL